MEPNLERKKASDFPQELLDTFDLYVHGEIDRREFLDAAKKFAVGGRHRHRHLGNAAPQLRLGRAGSQGRQAHQSRARHRVLAPGQRPKSKAISCGPPRPPASSRRFWSCTKTAA